MITKKDLVIVALATFCLTATIFAVIPTRSQSGNYNPWLDSNEDGKINILDIAATAKAFGSSGELTKNVTVEILPHKVLHLGTINMSGTGPITPNVGALPEEEVFASCGGYSRMTVLIRPIQMSSVSSGTYTFTLIVSSIDWNSQESSYYATLTERLGNNFNLTITRSTNGWMYPPPEPLIIQISAPHFRIWFYRVSTDPDAWAVFDVFVYLRNE